MIDVSRIVEKNQEKWINFNLTEVNDSIVRLGIFEGEFHWHKHDHEDEFFLTLDGKLIIEIEGAATVALLPWQGYVVPKGVVHKTKAPEKTIVLMIETKGIIPTGDA